MSKSGDYTHEPSTSENRVCEAVLSGVDQPKFPMERVGGWKAAQVRTETKRQSKLFGRSADAARAPFTPAFGVNGQGASLRQQGFDFSALP